MYQPPMVNFPVFSVAWGEATDDDGNTKPAALTAGGGGAGNTGVGNKISLISFNSGPKGLTNEVACELETSPQTSNCVAATKSGQIMAAAFGRTVKVYASLPSGFHPLAEFQADHSDRESSVNSMAFIAGGENSDGAQLLATGGEDGVLRVWELSADRNGATAALGNDTGAINSDGGEEHRAASLEVTQLCECEGHSKSITCVRIHSSGEVVLTASKDGTCRLWDWRRNSQAALLATTSGLPASVLAPQVMCRACCFAPHRPDLIYSVQSGPRGKAYVTEWKYRIEEGRREKPSGAMNGGGDGLEGVITCAVEPSKVKYVSPHPATTMSVRQDGARLAVGNVEGTVLVYRLPGFAKVMEYPAHDLPVTGLAFAPGDTGVALGGFDLLAGSADYKITLFKTQGSAVKLACGQVLRGLWWLVVMVITSILFILRAIVSIIMTVIPLMGLCAIGAAVYYYPTSLRDVAISFYDEIAVELGWEPMSVVGEDREPEERVPLVG